MRPLRTCWVVLLLVLAGAASARADSIVVVTEGRFGAAETQTFASAGGQGTAAGIQVFDTPGDPGANHASVQIAPAYGDTLEAGRVYDFAQGSAEAEHAGLRVSRSGVYCEGGRFEIRDIAFGPNETVTRLWAVFECGNGRPDWFGEVRFGLGGDTSPALVRWPLTDAGWRGADVPVTLTAATATTVAGASITGPDASSFAISDNACAGRTLAAGQQCTVTTRYLAATPGTKRATLRFTLSGGAVRDTALEGFAFGGTTRLKVNSEAGDPIGAGPRSWEFGPGEFAFSGSRSGVRASGYGGPDLVWDVDVSPARGDVLGNGLNPRTVIAVRSQGGAHPCPTSLGDATVSELRTRAGDGSVRAFSGTFSERCDNAGGAVSGSIEVRAGDTTPLPPWVDGRPGPAAPASGSVTFLGDPDAYVGQGAVGSYTDVAVRPDGSGIAISAHGPWFRMTIHPKDGERSRPACTRTPWGRTRGRRRTRPC